VRTFERRIRAVERSGNAEVNDFDYTRSGIKHNFARIGIFMNDIGSMNATQNVYEIDRKL